MLKDIVSKVIKPKKIKLPLKNKSLIKSTIQEPEIKAPVVKKIIKLPLKKHSAKKFTHIPEELREMADNQSLTKDALIEADYTDLLRLPFYNEYARKFIRENFKLEGLPLLAQYRLHPHQVKALTWMLEREQNLHYGIRGGILSLEMGLGKSLTAIAHSIITGKGEYPTLIIASKTVLHQAWKSDGFEKFFADNDIKILYLHKDFLGKDIKYITRKSILEYDFVLTTYDVCVRVCNDKEYFKDVCVIGEEGLHMGKTIEIQCRTKSQANKPDVIGEEVIYGTPWHRVFCDESQKFANPTTKIYRAMMTIYGDYKWCLSGTPIRNYTTDIWAQLRFCGYTGVNSRMDWKRKGQIKYKEHQLSNSVLCMTTTDAGVIIPPCEIVRHDLKHSEMEEQIYRYVLGTAKTLYDQMLNGLVKFSNILAIFTRLRQCCIAPYLMTARAKREKLIGTEALDDEGALAKLQELLNTSPLGKWVYDRNGGSGINSTKIREIVSTVKSVPDEKFIIFSKFTSCLDLVAGSLDVNAPDIQYVQVDGDNTGEERSILLDSFKNDPDVHVLLLSYTVGSEGLNLTQATRVICIEPWWSPTVIRQAVKRAWRPGQTKTVYQHDLIMKDTIEQKILEICNEKDKLADHYLKGSEYKMKKHVGLDKVTLGRILGKYKF